jgi:hypothetical protein
VKSRRKPRIRDVDELLTTGKCFHAVASPVECRSGTRPILKDLAFKTIVTGVMEMAKKAAKKSAKKKAAKKGKK